MVIDNRGIRSLMSCVALTIAAVDLAHAQRNPVASPAAPNEQRVALVIGNSAYKESPLKNPVNDATDMAAALRELGFKVSLRTDANQRQMKQALREFAQDIRRGGVGLFYFAGHGVQSKGKNFLIPIGASVETEAELEDDSVDANLVLSYMDEAQNRVNIVVLDACRNNPFARSFRSASRGLAQMEAAKGSFVAFATAPGSVAADGNGRNGVYTEHLLASLKEPDGDIDKVFRRVAASVSTVTGGRQVPWVASSLTGDFYFRMPAASDETKLKRAELERTELANALEQERKRREQETAAVKQRSEQERAEHAKELDEARKQREKDAEQLRAEMAKLRAELQKIRTDAAVQPPAPITVPTVATTPAAKPVAGTPPGKPAQVAIEKPPPSPTSNTSPQPSQPGATIAPPAGASTVATAAASKPVPSTPPEKPAQVAITTPPPSPASAAPAQPSQQLAIVAPSISSAGAPATADKWKDRLGVLEKARGQLTYSKAIALLLGVSAEEELESLVKYQALLKRMPYHSAFALGVNDRGYLKFWASWRWTSTAFASQTALDRCNGGGTGGSCRVVMIDGEFQEKEFMEAVARLGQQAPDLVRRQYVGKVIPSALARGLN